MTDEGKTEVDFSTMSRGGIVVSLLCVMATLCVVHGRATGCKQ